MFTGTYTALVTPFRDGQVDEKAFKQLIHSQIRAGIDGIVPVGTTGESPTLSFEEHIRVIELAVEFAAKRVPVLAGTGANSTDEAIYLTRAAKKAGADGSLQVAPYYNKPSQQGLFEHFRAIVDAAPMPVVLYSIPGRCGIEIAVETVAQLAAASRFFVGIKEAGGNADRVSQLRAALDPRFTILSGDDSLTLPFMAVGASGVVSVASNLIPRELVKMVRAFGRGDIRVALRLHEKYFRLFKDLFIETNPLPVKAALAMLGQIAEEYRLPLVPMQPKCRKVLEESMRICGVLRK